MKDFIHELEVVKFPSVKEPVATIAITTYNRPDLLKDALRSALNQKDAGSFEVIVCDNKGMEETRQLILSLKDVECLGYFVNKKNIGPVGNWNRALQLARGEYVTILHDDDALAPVFLKRGIKILSKGRFGGYFCRFYGGEKVPESWDTIEKVEFFKPTEFLYGSMTAFPGVLFKKELIKKTGPFEEKWMPLPDYVYWMKLASVTQLGKDRARLAFYRASESQDSAKLWKAIVEKTYIVIYLVFRNYGFSSPSASFLSKLFGARIELNYAGRHLGRGKLIALKLMKRISRPISWILFPLLNRVKFNFDAELN